MTMKTMSTILVYLLLFSLLTLTSCTDSAEPSGSAPPPSQESSQPTSSSAEPPTEQPSEPSQDDIIQQQVSEAIAELKTEDFASADVLSRLADMGIEVQVEQIKEIDEQRISFDLLMKTSADHVFSLPLTATYFYNWLDPEVFNGKIVGNFRVEWGGLSVVDDTTVAISTLQNITFLDAQTLADTGPELMLPDFGGKDYYLLGAKRDDTLGIVVPIFTDDKDGFAFFNDDGTFRELQTFEYGRPGERHFYTTVNAEHSSSYSLHFADDFEILNLDAPYLVFSDTYYNAETKKIFGESFSEIDAADGNRRVVLRNFDMGFGHFPAVTGEKSRLALYYESNKLQSGFFFNGDEISPSFGRPNKEDYAGLTYQWDSGKPIMSASCPFSDLTIGLNFETQTASLEYNIDPAHLEDAAFAVSPDGRYSLYRASRDGGGDISMSNIVLKDNEFDALRFLGLSGGMYGGHGDIGFLSNGDIYMMSLESLQILSSDPNAPVPLRPFNLPLGPIDESETRRSLHTFRRDPVTLEYIVLYSEETVGSTWTTGDIPYEASYNYIVGFCDQEGNLLESYDTGAPVLGDHFGLDEMNFKLTGDQLEITASNGKGYESMRGVFDLKTHSYTEISDAEETE